MIVNEKFHCCTVLLLDSKKTYCIIKTYFLHWSVRENKYCTERIFTLDWFILSYLKKQNTAIFSEFPREKKEQLCASC